ncbi:MAG: phosphatase PAP2 family protein [Tepidanaerobacter acetatoxydans]|uniref:phosphatase PAP2 family protein n=1 Tax=Tepidanaerobacter acetatoxydans TaxID=499229 RepID=UPI0026EC5857|nr:phosphatase PAP2 family protein [Tepidanaerobacter acetatoxydans]NLU10509.1 phosphatase PAP2 family protein [Tepidanaerobacter acetatoxydans]
MELQAEIIKIIQSFSNPILDTFFIAVTNLGSSLFYYLMIPIFYWNINKKTGITLIASLLFSMYINVSLKEVVTLARPIGYPGIRSLFVISAGGFSFPSGHAQGTSTFWGVIMKCYRRRWVYILGTTVIFLVSLSRLYLGVHWPLDVLIGIILGLSISSVFVWISRICKPIPLIYNTVLSIIVPIILVCLFPYEDNFIYTGMLSGSWLGCVWENYFIGFEPKCKTRIKTLIKYLIGIIGFLLIYEGLKLILPPYNFCRMLRYFSIGLWLTFGAPIFFYRLGL